MTMKLKLNNESLAQLQKEIDDALVGARTTEDVDAVRVQYLGRKNGVLTEALKSLKDLGLEEKKVFGPLLNDLKNRIEEQLTRAEHALDVDQSAARDLTLPGIVPETGHLHPMTLVQHELMDIFRSMGFMIVEGPELDQEFYNFESLNIPKTHPARDIQDTFFIKTPITRKEKRDLPKTGWVMRTHTSNMQVRIMEEYGAPLRCVVPARVFRNESTDASHEHTFYQFECFVVDEKINIGNLLWTIQEIFRQLYKKDVKVRLRPGYFPFTEPSFEPDMSCVFCDGVGCRVCKYTGWVEMGGSGMIHPNVFKAAGFPEGKYTGFAFGMGMSRLAMLKYGLPDVRLFMDSDLRILKQF
ncbi:MAG: phenylalanine--tRNA ligase subunit alpha [Candidatus Kerfeldbacteria bacterium]|nr:phenylalanine--tRNA ligase subunit alpha [Candidatus Kerfeldbacteria bacterium]